MAEILTESFCERCGTRYTFEAAIPKKRRIGRLKVLSKGLKNYVLSEDASLDEALAEARSEEERELSGGQLDAFHQTFQFCMSCRQYTCANCWNEAEGRCLSCAPLELIGTSLRSPLDDLLAGGGMAPLAPLAPPTAVEELPATAATIEANGTTNGHVAHDEHATNGSAWPTIDLLRTADEQAAAPAPEAEVVSAAEAVAGAPVADETVAAPQAELEPATDFWTRPFTGFAPEPTNGHHADPEPELVPAAEPAIETEPVVEAIAEAEPVTAVEAIAEPVAEADPIAEAEPVALAEVAAEPVAEAEPVAAAEPVTEPVAEAEPVAAAEPVAEAEPVAAAEPLAEAEPVAVAQALDPQAEARAAELAERTSRLLGRFRVQPRSAATTATEQAAAADAAAAAAAAREIAAAAAAASPAPVEPTVLAEPEPPAAPIVSPAPEQPSWMFVARAPEPEPAPVPVLQAWPEPVVWGEWKSEAMIAGTLEVPASAQSSFELEPDEAPAPVAADEPVAAEDPPEVAAVAEPVADAAPVEPEPVVMAQSPSEPEPSPAPVAAEPAPPRVAAQATDRIEMPAWPTLARPRLSDSAPVPPQPVPPVVQAPTQAPQWPAPLRPDIDVSSTPFWASGQAKRPAGELDVWDASAREVTSAPGISASPVGVQACVSCGLSLSATARFCRRCGSRQG